MSKTDAAWKRPSQVEGKEMASVFKIMTSPGEGGDAPETGCGSGVERQEEEAGLAREQLEQHVQEKLEKVARELRNEGRQRRAVEEVLRRSEQKWTAFFENAPVAMQWCGPDGIIIRANRNHLEMLGYTAEEYVGHPLKNFFVDEPVFKDILTRLLTGETVHDFPARLRCKDGSIKQVLIDSNILSQNGKSLHTRCFFRDITKRVKAEQELQQRRDELAHACRVNEMGELAASISHEISQPLTVILSTAEAVRRLLATDEAEPEKLDTAMRELVASATRAGDILRRQRNFLRGGKVQITSVDINQLIRNVERHVRAEVHYTGIRLTLDLVPDLPRIEGDPSQLEQVLLNLVRNSVEAMKNGVRVRELRVQTSIDGQDGVRIRVSDTGPPIDDESFAQMFERFYSTKARGLGIGLSISRSIVEVHEGLLWPIRNPESGLTMNILLPYRS